MTEVAWLINTFCNKDIQTHAGLHANTLNCCPQTWPKGSYFRLCEEVSDRWWHARCSPRHRRTWRHARHRPMKILHLRGLLPTPQICQGKKEWIKIYDFCWQMLAIIYYYIYITHTMLEQTCLQRPNFFRSIQCWRNSGRCAACFAAFQLSSALGGGKVISLGGCSKWVLVTSFCWCKQSQREIPKDCIHLASLLTRLEANLATVKWHDYKKETYFAGSFTGKAFHANLMERSGRLPQIQNSRQLSRVSRWR